MDVARGRDGRPRCAWAYDGAAMTAYHDEEWGVPVQDDAELWAKLMLDTFQAGLSWRVVLEKRAHFRQAFDGWNPQRIAAYGPEKIAELMANPAIIRNRAKILAAISNAQAFLALQAREGSFRLWLMQFVDHRPLIDGTGPATTPEALRMSRALKTRGFKFTGPIVCYAFMQATGFAMDHAPGCFRAAPCTALLRQSVRPGGDGQWD